jgi:hypothetical protein
MRDLLRHSKSNLRDARCGRLLTRRIAGSWPRRPRRYVGAFGYLPASSSRCRSQVGGPTNNCFRRSKNPTDWVCRISPKPHELIDFEAGADFCDATIRARHSSRRFYNWWNAPELKPRVGISEWMADFFRMKIWLSAKSPFSWRNWLGRQDSNLGMAESKSV